MFLNILCLLGFALDADLASPFDNGSSGEGDVDVDRLRRGASMLDPDWNQNPDTLLLLNLYKEDQYLGELTDDIHGICPGWLPCLMKEPTLQGDVSCCLACSCNVMCNVTQNCCPGVMDDDDDFTLTPDSVLHGSNYEKETVCMKPVYFMYDPETLYEFDLKNQEYEFVSVCPKGSDSTLKAKCFAQPTFGVKDRITFMFVDIMAVTDVKTGTNYVNRHCAACHGVNTTDMQFWEPIISCKDIIGEIEIARIEETVQGREDCYVQFTPPRDAMYINESMCISGVISECNVTGEWLTYDAQIEAYCMSIVWVYTMTYSPPSDPFNVVRYGNIFCAVCNGEPVVRPNTELCPYDELGFLQTYPFTGMMTYANVKPVGQLESENAGQRCPMDKRLEPIEGRCEFVICSYPMIWNAVTQTCVDLYREINYGQFKIPFEVKLAEPVGIEYISDRADLIEKLGQTVLHGICSYPALFFKSPTTQFNNTSTTSPNDIYIDSLFLIAYESADRFGSLRYNPREFYTSFINYIVNSDMSALLDINVREIIHGNADTFFLPNTFDEEIEFTTFNLNRDGELGFSKVDFFLLEDPYDGSIIFGNNLSFPSYFYRTCEKYNIIFDDTFLDCPAFMYDMTEYGIERTKYGITFTKQNITVEFQNFRSLNHTHCVICIDAIGYLGPPGNNHANTIHHILMFDHGLLWNIVLIGTLMAI